MSFFVDTSVAILAPMKEKIFKGGKKYGTCVLAFYHLRRGHSGRRHHEGCGENGEIAFIGKCLLFDKGCGFLQWVLRDIYKEKETPS